MYHLLSPAKLNLFLNVTGKRNDGYHELFSLMACIDFYDDMYFDFHTQGVSIHCSHPDVPEDESNIAYKAAMLFLEKIPEAVSMEKCRGVKIEIKKKIPVGGGLGGGSSNAATVLKALNSFFDNPFSIGQLKEMAVHLGADVSFFIDSRPAFACGIGEKLFGPVIIAPCHVLLLCPRFQSSTARVYKNLNLTDCLLTKSGKFNINLISKFHGRNKAFDVREYLNNDLETSAFELYPELRQFQKKIERRIPEKILMTGSGACFFVLFENYKRAVEIYGQLSAEWQGRDIKLFLTSIKNNAPGKEVAGCGQGG